MGQSDELICPCCGYKFRDAWELNTNGGWEEIDCPRCQATLEYSTELVKYFDVRKLEASDG